MKCNCLVSVRRTLSFIILKNASGDGEFEPRHTRLTQGVSIIFPSRQRSHTEGQRRTMNCEALPPQGCIEDVSVVGTGTDTIAIIGKQPEDKGEPQTLATRKNDPQGSGSKRSLKTAKPIKFGLILYNVARVCLEPPHPLKQTARYTRVPPAVGTGHHPVQKLPLPPHRGEAWQPTSPEAPAGGGHAGASGTQEGGPHRT